MRVKVYSYMEGMNAFSEDEIFYKLPDEDFDKTLTTNITERLKRSEKPWAKALLNLNIGGGLLAHKKDVLIREDLDDYADIKDSYDGVLFIDFNKLVKEIQPIIDYIESCNKDNSIGTLGFDDDLGLNHKVVKQCRTRAEMCNAFIYVPNSRFDEFHKLFNMGLKSSAKHLVNCYKDDKKRMSMMHLGYKLNKTDKSSNREELENAVLFHEFCKDQGIDYGLLQRTNFNKLYDVPKTLHNVKLLMMGADYIIDGDNINKIQGNKFMRFLRNGLSKSDPWNYISSDKHRVSKTEFQKRFNSIKDSISNFDERSKEIGRKFMEDLERCI